MQTQLKEQSSTKFHVAKHETLSINATLTLSTKLQNTTLT